VAKFLTRRLIGMPIVFLAVAPCVKRCTGYCPFSYPEGLMGVLWIFYYSIIFCGIGLFFWIPAFFFAGLCANTLFSVLDSAIDNLPFSIPKATVPQNIDVGTSTRHERGQLAPAINYARAATDRGLNDEAIKANLGANGWSNTNIE
jgi:hypothetical protein